MNIQHTLFYKWLIGNSFAVLVVYVAWLQGWIELILRSDASYLTWAIAVVFGVFWIISSYHILVLNRELTRFADGSPQGVAADYFAKLQNKSRNQQGALVDQNLLATTLRVRLMASVQVVGSVASTLILLGLIGTVVGFVVAVSGLGDSLGQGENVDRVKNVLSQIVNGMGVALFTTLVGSVLGGIWLQVHYQMLLRAVTDFVVRVVEHAEIELIPKLAVSREAGGVDAS